MRSARKFLTPFYDPERQPYVYELMPDLKEPSRHQGEIDLTALLSDLVPDALPFSKQDLSPFLGAYSRCGALHPRGAAGGKGGAGQGDYG